VRPVLMHKTGEDGSEWLKKSSTEYLGGIWGVSMLHPGGIPHLSFAVGPGKAFIWASSLPDQPHHFIAAVQYMSYRVMAKTAFPAIMTFSGIIVQNRRLHFFSPVWDHNLVVQLQNIMMRLNRDVP